MTRAHCCRWLLVAGMSFLALSPGICAGPAIKGVRSAHYPQESRTRVVLDCSSLPYYDVATHAANVVVTVRGGTIETDREHQIEGLPERVRLVTVGNGVAALISFRQSVRVNHFYEPPNSTIPHHRIVLDFHSPHGTDERGERRKCVVLDPGHGGWHNGARGSGRYSRLVEKDVVLDVGQRVRQLFEKNDSANTTEVFLTRTKDVLPFIPNGKVNQKPPDRSQSAYRSRDLAGRVRFAEEKAGLFGRDNTVFISLHVNWARSPRAHGFEVFIANDEAVARGERRELEERENAGIKAPALDPRVAYLIRSRARETSTLLGRSLLKELDKLNGMTPHGDNGGLHHANFIVLRTLDCPAVLVEIAFASNTSDARLLANDFFREEVARAVYNSVVQYFKKQNPSYAMPLMTAPLCAEYKVRAGDTLSSIASKSNTTYRRIMQLNGLRSATIYPGQVLRIPR